MQLGYDQGITRVAGHMSTSDTIVAKARFYGAGKDQILAGLDRLFWPATGRVVMRMPAGALYWQSCIEAVQDFVYGQGNTMLEFVPVPSVMVKDPLLHLKKVRGPTVDLTPALKGLSVAIEEEEEE